MKLVITEKPSVGVSIAKVIGANKRCDGYYEGSGFRVSWCVGHLVQMASPDKYDEKYAKWNMEDLPIIPSEFKYEVSKRTKKQFNILKKLMNAKDIDTVINACDAGREGESIFRLVYDKAACKKKIERLWISSMEDSAIKDGFNNLKNGKDYENLNCSAKARMQADWLVGMNLSRLYSLLYNQNYSVGRVQTPTLNMIVMRDEEIRNFKKEKYYTLEIVADEFSLSTSRIDDISEVTKLKDEMPSDILVTDVIEKEKITRPDKLFDLTTLQRECNKYFGFRAKQTLDYAQSLYEKKLITYPRTDSRFLTEDMESSTLKLLDNVEILNENFKRIFNSSKVTDHHAIIPTSSSVSYELDTLQTSEKKVFDLVRDKLYMGVSPNKVEKNTKVIARINDYDFTASGTVLIDEGFSKYLVKYQKSKKETILPKVTKGEILKIKNSKINEKYTTQPKHFTEDSLLKAMEVAGSDAIDKTIEVERKGLGTPATRAGIIENLIYKGYIERDKKNLLATNKAISLVTVVKDSFKSAETTSDWEMKLSRIASGEFSKNEFLSDIKDEITSTIKQYVNK